MGHHVEKYELTSFGCALRCGIDGLGTCFAGANRQEKNESKNGCRCQKKGAREKGDSSSPLVWQIGWLAFCQ